MERVRPLAASSSAARHDGALLARLASGEISALASLYDVYAPTLLKFARRLGMSHDAEDVVQTVFLRVPRLAASFDPASPSARSWLFAITIRVVQERRRSLRRLAAATRALVLLEQPITHESPGRAADLEQCLNTLPLAKRSVVVLADIEGFSCEEIASMLKIPIGTVWTRLYYARRKLRQAWSEVP